MENICTVLSCQAFPVNDKTIVRELGWSTIEKGDIHYYRLFDHHIDWQSMSFKDQWTFNFIKKQLSGLAFKPTDKEKNHDNFMPCQEDLGHFVRYLWNEHKRGDKNVVAHKGNPFLEEVLSVMDIPHVDLETFDCPPYTHLRGSSVQGCGNHGHYFLCSAQKSDIYMQWIQQQLKTTPKQ